MALVKRDSCGGYAANYPGSRMAVVESGEDKQLDGRASVLKPAVASVVTDSRPWDDTSHWAKYHLL